MMNFWRFLHILAAVAAFGPGFAFPFIGALARKTPGSFPLVAKLGETLGKRLIIPGAVIVLLTGLAQVGQLRINLLRTPYILISLILFLAALAISVFVQLPAGKALARMADGAPPGPPPPEAMSLIQKQKVMGMLLLSLFVIILALMVFSPGDIETF